MGDVIKLNNVIDIENTGEAVDIIALSDELLESTCNDTEQKKTISMPIAEMATLDAGMASLLPAFRTVT